MWLSVGRAVVRRGRPTEAVVLSEEQEKALQSFANSRSLPHGLVVRSRIVLSVAEGKYDSEVAKEVGKTRQTVALWRKRFIERGLEGLYAEYRSGRPRSIEDERIAGVVDKTLKTKPEGATHWSVRTMAEASGLSKSTVHRVWNAFGLQPHRYEHFKISTDPFFVEKVRDIVGLYLNPPQKAVVLCVDEKSQCQALERSQPMLPMGLGYVEGITHDYVRHGTTTLFAALEVANGQVLTECKSRHRHQEFLAFLRCIEKNVPAELDVHFIVDNYSPHKHAKVKGWLAAHPRFHMHFIPTYASWLNQVERWFGLITQRAIRRGSFTCVKDLVSKIDEFVQAYNNNCKPFMWHATADSILEKIERLCERISGTVD